MEFNKAELSALELLTLDKSVALNCELLELSMNRDYMDDFEYKKERDKLLSVYRGTVNLHNKILNYLEE